MIGKSQQMSRRYPIRLSLLVSVLRLNAGLQVTENDWSIARRMAKRMRRGHKFPPLEVVRRRSGVYNICDGNHRFLAWLLRKEGRIPVLLFRS